MDLYQLIYVSRPFGFDAPILNSILMKARQLNARDGITGALICRADMYLQLLEGAKPLVEAAFDRIARDDRHLEVNRLVSGPIDKRLFGQWAMRDDPVKSWMWSKKEVADGAIPRASQDEVIAVFERLLDEQPVNDGALH